MSRVGEGYGRVIVETTAAVVSEGTVDAWGRTEGEMGEDGGGIITHQVVSLLDLLGRPL